MIGALERVVNKVSNALEFNKVKSINQATLSGCVDTVAVQYPDGSFRSSPFYIRFGKLKVLKSKEEVISIYINDIESSVKMKLGAAGEGYFEVPVNIQ